MEGSQVIADARRLVGSLGQLPTPQAQPAIIVVSGLPGTGKSYFCRRLAERLSFLILESDALRKLLFNLPTYSASENTHLFRTIYYLIEELLRKGMPVILDATNLEERHRERIYNIAERLNARLIMVRVEAPPELVQKRLQARTEKKNMEDSSDADWTVYQKMKTTVQKISRNHFTVDTSKDVTPVIDKIIREVNR
jgi:predicted kinase